MAWGSHFFNLLASSAITPKYTLEFIDTPDFNGYYRIVTGGYQTNSPLQISDEGPNINGCKVTPGSWAITFGSFSVPLVGDITKIFPAVKRGSLAQLFCTLGNHKERIAVGQLRNISGFKNNWRLDFVDLLTAMTSRVSNKVGLYTDDNVPDQMQFFYKCGLKALSVGTWPDLGSGFPTQLNVDDVRPFQDNIANRTSGESGLIRCIANGSSNEFYLNYDSVTLTGGTAGYLTLSQTYTTTTKVYPSINYPENMLAGSEIYASALLDGPIGSEPWAILARMLISKEGTRSWTFDEYPKSWNFGSVFDLDIFDWGDAVNHMADIQSDLGSLDYRFGIVVDSPWSNGIREFISICSSCGHWPVFRQDSITWRGAANPFDVTQIKAYIRDNDIITINKIDLFNPNQRNQYQLKQIKHTLEPPGATGNQSKITYGTTNEINSIPILPLQTIDNNLVYGYDYTDKSKRGDLATNDLKRMERWYTNTSSKIALVLPLNFAGLCAGDFVELESNFIDVFISGKSKLRGMVTAINYNIGRQKVYLELSILGTLQN